MTGVTVASIDCCIVSLPRDVPYLGPLQPGETANAQGYFVRRGNRTVYPATDMSVIVKATAADGTVGWGETYGIAAPEAVVPLIERLLAPFVTGRDAREPATIWQDLYDLQRVRGASGGHYGDALAGIDIALHDLAASTTRRTGRSRPGWCRSSASTASSGPALMAAGVISLAPMVVLFLLLEPFLVSGMTAGSQR
jgi:hypothetical protein